MWHSKQNHYKDFWELGGAGQQLYIQTVKICSSLLPWWCVRAITSTGIHCGIHALLPVPILAGVRQQVPSDRHLKRHLSFDDSYIAEVQTLAQFPDCFTSFSRGGASDFSRCSGKQMMLFYSARACSNVFAFGEEYFSSTFFFLLMKKLRGNSNEGYFSLGLMLFRHFYSHGAGPFKLSF